MAARETSGSGLGSAVSVGAASPGAGLCRGIVVGLAGALVIWLATPTVNFVLRIGFIADGQLPTGAFALTCFLVLMFNPLLRRFLPRFALNRVQLATAVGIMLVASVPASGGFLRMMVHSVARVPYQVSSDQRLAALYGRLDLPRSLFPSELGFQSEVSASEDFLNQLAPGACIPWVSWVGPLLSWGFFALCSFLLMIGLGWAVFPQWRDNERLPFPLVSLQEPLLGDPVGGGMWGPLFCSGRFWLAAGLVFAVHFLGGASAYWPESVPSIPLSFNVRSVFAGEPFRYLPHYIWHNRIYFTFAALAFFMPTRIGFSIWFWQVAYALYSMMCQAYFPPYHSQAVACHRSGAMAMLAVWIIWLGRQHWSRMLRDMLPRRGVRVSRLGVAGWLICMGSFGLVLWLRWAGAGWGGSLSLVVMALMLSLVTARLVAETGLIQVWLYESQLLELVKWVPAACYSPVTLFFVGIVGVVFGNGGRVCCAAMLTHALGLQPDPKQAPQGRLVGWFIPVLLAGVVVCGAMHLRAGYHHATSIDGQWKPLTPWGSSQFEHSHRLLREQEQGAFTSLPFSRTGHLAAGAVLAGACQALCLLSPRWPLHPVGLLIVTQWHANLIWFSVFLGWLAKVILLRYGGSRLHRGAKPVVLGLIIGELAAGVFWMLFGIVWIALGQHFRVVPIIPY